MPPKLVIYAHVTASKYIDHRRLIPDLLYWPYRYIFACCTSHMDISLPSCHTCHADTLLPGSCTSPIKTLLSAWSLDTERPPYLPVVYPYRCLSTCSCVVIYMVACLPPAFCVCIYIGAPCCAWLTNFLVSPCVSDSKKTQVTTVTWPVCYTFQHSCIIFRWHV